MLRPIRPARDAEELLRAWIIQTVGFGQLPDPDKLLQHAVNELDSLTPPR